MCLLNIIKFFKSIFCKKKQCRLTTAWFINSLPSEISERKEAESLLQMLMDLNSNFSSKDLEDYVIFTPKKERELLSAKMIELVDGYLKYEIEMTNCMMDLTKTQEFKERISEKTVEKLYNYANENLNDIKKTINVYRDLINFICK